MRRTDAAKMRVEKLIEKELERHEQAALQEARLLIRDEIKKMYPTRQIPEDASLRDCINIINRPPPGHITTDTATVRRLSPKFGPWEVDSMGDVVPTLRVREVYVQIPKPVRALPPEGCALLSDGQIVQIGSRFKVIDRTLLPVLPG
jgi:hypothetical protein